MKTLSALTAALLLALPLALGAHAPALAQQARECLSPREIMEGVQSGEILSVDEAMSAAGVTERPIGVPDVCRRDGNLEYHVNTINEYGDSDTKVLNAQGS